MSVSPAPEDAELGVKAKVPAGRRASTGTFDGKLEDYSLRPTDAEFVDEVEPLGFMGCLNFTFILIVNSLPAMILVALWAIFFSVQYNAAVGAVLDALDAQPGGYAPLNFDYAANAAPAAPPGAGPHGGPHVYGHRSDLGDEFAGVPSISVAMMSGGYYSFGIEGHPDVGMGVLEGLFAVSAVSSIGSYGFLTLLFVVLYGESTQKFGKEVWILWPISVAAYCVQYIMERDMAREDKVAHGSAKYFFFGVVVFSLLVMKYRWKANYIMRAIGSNLLLCTMGGFIIPVITAHILTALPELYLVLFRLVGWPLVEEIWLGWMRWFLRSIPAGAVDKAGAALALIPIKTVTVLLGRFLIFSLRDPTMMVVCSVGLFVVEVGGRCSVGVRDRAYTKVLTCCNREKLVSIFSDPAHRKLRANNTTIAMMIEYVAMVFGLIGALMLQTTNGGDLPDVNGILFNFFLQVVLEVLSDAASLYLEVNYLKLPLVMAWKARSPKFVWAFPSLVLSLTALTSVAFMESFFCPMRLPGQAIAWQYC